MPRFPVKHRLEHHSNQTVKHRLSELSLVPHHPFIINQAPHDKHGPSKSFWEHVYMYLLGNGPTLRLLDSGDSPEETSACSSCDSCLGLAMSHWRASLEGGGIEFPASQCGRVSCKMPSTSTPSSSVYAFPPRLLGRSLAEPALAGTGFCLSLLGMHGVAAVG